MSVAGSEVAGSEVTWINSNSASGNNHNLCAVLGKCAEAFGFTLKTESADFRFPWLSHAIDFDG
jgi:hypothetical protein